jgi:hypothetical protein
MTDKTPYIENVSSLTPAAVVLILAIIMASNIVVVQGIIKTSQPDLQRPSVNKQISAQYGNPHAEQMHMINHLLDVYDRLHPTMNTDYPRLTYKKDNTSPVILHRKEVIQDARYAWNYIQIYDRKGINALESSMWMYKITGDKKYLDNAIYIADNLDPSIERRKVIIS